ncbi:hypothetical protein POVWA2_060330 [Plasmodium ovale wallikeri]|uniref:Uncharacterized protein n=2 Tax=Plasmodium ovale TaxID=36330 RepID=A0A1A9A326_PLAOA|nr:hypothetical protein POVWA1_060990 [Plasmodium ovale wallikeri]SBT50492.1 hypothetical protein POVWA2_060330 [Plasmodium ovale wallikeri]SBT82760.1 N-alpha-acetyltransferase 15, NatA auxiliary subunit, putative [Plasmodium ovale]
MHKQNADSNKLPNKEMNNFRLMTQMIELKKHKKAFKICEHILKKYPKHGETLAMKGYLLNAIDENNKEEAFKCVKEGIKNNLSSSFCWYLYGCLYKVYKNYDEALKCYLKSVQLNRQDYKALKESCILLLYLKKYEQFRDLRMDVYNDTLKGIRDKAILVFAFHLLNQYEKCYLIIKQIEYDIYTNEDEIGNTEKYELFMYIAEILLEGKMYKECLRFLEVYENIFLDKLWYYQMIALIHLYEDNFVQANIFFKKAFSLNYENLNLLLLILFTEDRYFIEGGDGSSGDCTPDGVLPTKKEKELETENTHPNDSNAGNALSLSNLFFLDYKNEHKMDEKVNIGKNVKVLLHEFILDIYGSNRNLKLLSHVQKNVLNDYVCHNLDMKSYDIYTISEFNNFVNVNIVSEENFKHGLDSPNIDHFICSLKELEEKSKSKQAGMDIHMYNNIQWSQKVGVDLLYSQKRKFEKYMNILHFYKIKKLNDNEEKCFELYFKHLQKMYKNSNLLKIFPLYFYNERKFAHHVEKLFRSLCFQKCLTVFSYFKPFFTINNIKIMLFLLHRYMDNYDKTQEVLPLDGDGWEEGGDVDAADDDTGCADRTGGADRTGCADDTGCDGGGKGAEDKKNYGACLVGDNLENGQKTNQPNGNVPEEDQFEKREYPNEGHGLTNHIYSKTEKGITITKKKDEVHIGGDHMVENSKSNCITEKQSSEHSKKGDMVETNEIKKDTKNEEEELLLGGKEEMKDNIQMSEEQGGGDKADKENMNKKSNDKEKKEIKLDLKKTILTKQEKNEYFMLCVYSFVSQLYDYINCPRESLQIIDKCINSIKHKINESLKYELIFIKGLIYKRNGNYVEAYTCLEKCRKFHIGDRYINSKTIKTCLKCGFIKDARKMASIFTNPLDNNFIKNINDTQCFWIEYNLALSYLNGHPNIHLNGYLDLKPSDIYDFGEENGRVNCGNGGIDNGNNPIPMGDNQLNIGKNILVENDFLSRNELSDYNKGLYFLHLGHKQFLEIHEDQICFYYYTVRKLLYRSYRHLLYMTSLIFSSRFYRKFGKTIIRTLLHMHDYGMIPKIESNKHNKKKNKTNASTGAQEDNELYEHMKKDPLENAQMYMNTFLSQPNIDLGVHHLNYEIEKRAGKDYAKMSDIILRMKSIFPHHNYHYKLAPVISHYLNTVPMDSINEDEKNVIVAKLNDILGLSNSTYNAELLKKIRKEYMDGFIQFCKKQKKGDLSYYQSALEMYMTCGEKVDEALLGSGYVDPKKNKLGRCFKFLKFLIKNKERHSELTHLMDRFKALCKESFPLATAFQ